MEWTDGVRKHPETVAAWHKEMADVLRKTDLWKHLVTTSSTPNVAGMYETVDYLQPHRYQSNPIALGSAPVDKGLPKRPAFLGEFGSSAQGTGEQEGNFLTVALFASLMHDWQGAAQILVLGPGRQKRPLPTLRRRFRVPQGFRFAELVRGASD